MKTKWFSKVLSSLFALTLIFGSVSFASAKGPENGKPQAKPAKGHEEDKSADKEDKSTGKEEKRKKVTTKKVVIKSKVGKSLEKRVNASESTINSLTKSINTYFGVNEDGTIDKELSKKTAASKYNSYKGKLNAEINKLRAFDKQIASYKKKYKSITAELDELAVKSKELQKLAANEIARVKTLAKEASAPKPEDDPTQPTEQPTEPATEPATEPTEPATEPTQPAA
ncbi:hypothetical protein [Peribacillus glennii]|uniref:Uncharacterized protein n=1 Tax=Peribacillus glennii TaxID=2303991 RepID=A0A372L745_9BACI|nr:hypothetical protein [Peribacillus glennii]RFU60985.1 hypothetical protein D0466_19880 [Peribacillus glennii]